jgi:hypothetical protein
MIELIFGDIRPQKKRNKITYNHMKRTYIDVNLISSITYISERPSEYKFYPVKPATKFLGIFKNEPERASGWYKETVVMNGFDSFIRLSGYPCVNKEDVFTHSDTVGLLPKNPNLKYNGEIVEKSKLIIKLSSGEEFTEIFGAERLAYERITYFELESNSKIRVLKN